MSEVSFIIAMLFMVIAFGFYTCALVFDKPVLNFGGLLANIGQILLIIN